MNNYGTSEEEDEFTEFHIETSNSEITCGLAAVPSIFCNSMQFFIEGFCVPGVYFS